MPMTLGKDKSITAPDTFSVRFVEKILLSLRNAFTTVNLNSFPLIENTITQYRHIIDQGRQLFEKKTKDYGTSWRILRLPSLTDQIFIKAQRIRSIQEKGTQKVTDTIEEEFMGMINYCLIALMQIKLTGSSQIDLSLEETMHLFDEGAEETMKLLTQKNHDYDEAWRSMRVSSMTDIILMKLLRIKQIEDNEGRTLVSEGVKANYQDIINYSVFSLILLNAK